VKRSSVDVRSLLSRLEVEDFPYREIFRENGAASVADRWMLLSETNRALEELRRQLAEQAPKAASPYRKDIVSPFDEATRRSHKAPRLLDLTREFANKQHEDHLP
jgi:hypothetical protein